MLFDHLVLSIDPETHWSTIPELKKENVVQNHHVGTINETYLAGLHFVIRIENGLEVICKHGTFSKLGHTLFRSATSCTRSSRRAFQAFSVIFRRP
jgi:hypothetical protein